MRFVSEGEIEAVLEYPPLIELMRATMVDYCAGTATQPVRSRMVFEQGLMMIMPAYTGTAVGQKTLLFPRDHRMQAFIEMFEPATGALTAVLDAEAITAYRTAAMSAAATNALCPRDVRVLAILGTGTQARSHLEALPAVRTFEEVRVWGRDLTKAGALAAEFGALPVADARTAVRDADVVVTATAAREPVLSGKWLKPGAHVNAVGAPFPDWRELDDDVMTAALYVDSTAGALAESGDVLLSGATIRAEIGAVFADGDGAQVDVTESSVFKSLGMGVQDVAAAAWVLARL